MRVQVKRQVPPGSYKATFDGIEETDHLEYGPGFCWGWTISDGKQKGQRVFRTTKTEATARNQCGKFLIALTGLPLEKAGECDLDKFEGTRCHVIVGTSESGTSRVETFAVERREPGQDDDEVSQAFAEAGIDENTDPDEIQFQV